MYVFFCVLGVHIQELTAHSSNVHALAFSRHNLLATGSWDKQVIVWNPYKAEILYTLRGLLKFLV